MGAGAGRSHGRGVAAQDHVRLVDRPQQHSDGEGEAAEAASLAAERQRIADALAPPGHVATITPHDVLPGWAATCAHHSDALADVARRDDSDQDLLRRGDGRRGAAPARITNAARHGTRAAQVERAWVVGAMRPERAKLDESAPVMQTRRGLAPARR